MNLFFSGKRILSAAILILALLLLLIAFWLATTLLSLPDVRFLSDPRMAFSITVRDWHGNARPFIVGPENPFWTPFSKIPANLKNAVLAGEDFSFYSHRGVDWFEVRESFRKNLKMRRFARGASTITQQLAKNLFLSRDKTLRRKLQELILAHKLEKTLTKDRILELYLNVVELGEMVYGVGEGSAYHFGKFVTEITLRESAFLAAMLPGPRVYNPENHLDRVMNRLDHILSVMLRGHMITEGEFLAALNEIPFSEEALPPGYPDPEPVLGDEEEIPAESIVNEIPTPYLPGEKEPQPVPIPETGTPREIIPDQAPGNAPSSSSATFTSRKGT